jgi:transcriptional regulator with XRE-family HTH domain
MPDKLELGERLKRFRLGRNLTLKDVELKAKVSATHISEIERGMTSPTVGALTKIAKALGSEPSYFLQSEEYAAVSVVRRQNRRVFTDQTWGAQLNRLCVGIRGSEMSFLVVEIEPGQNEMVQAITHNGEEFIHVLKGVIEVFIGLDRHLLKEGDSIHFRTYEPYSVRNIGDGTSQMLWVTLPPFCL